MYSFLLRLNVYYVEPLSLSWKIRLWKNLGALFLRNVKDHPWRSAIFSKNRGCFLAKPMNNGTPPEITFKLFVLLLSIIAWRVKYLNIYVIFVCLWRDVIYKNYMRSLSMRICYTFVLHCSSRTTGTDSDIHQQLKSE